MPCEINLSAATGPSTHVMSQLTAFRFTPDCRRSSIAVFFEEGLGAPVGRMECVAC